MNPQRVLVAFSSRSGSTAGMAEEIASVLRAAGHAVDCRPEGEVADVVPYRAVVLGSGVFVTSRASDGGGFLERHAAALRGRDVWLFSSGPIGVRAGHGDASVTGECAAVTVGRAIGARGVAMFGTIGLPAGEDPLAALPADRRDIRAWANEIAAQLGTSGLPTIRGRHRCQRIAVTG